MRKLQILCCVLALLSLSLFSLFFWLVSQSDNDIPFEGFENLTFFSSVEVNNVTEDEELCM